MCLGYGGISIVSRATGLSRPTILKGKELYPNAKDIFITADGGGSNGSRNRLWKFCLQEFADESGMTIHVSHFPPGTSKWNKIEHRLFNHISMNWKRQPLTSLDVIINLIGHTTSQTRLEFCECQATGLAQVSGHAETLGC